MISIGAVYYGPELQDSNIDRAITAVSKALKEFRGSWKPDGKPWVNAVFVIAGSRGDTEFDGLIYGDYSKKTKGIVVQIAVPREIGKQRHLSAFVVEALHGANAMAFEFFRKKGEQFNLGEAENMVKETARALQMNK